MRDFFSKRPGLGIGLGVGLLGAAVLAVRYGIRKTLGGPLPDYVSPAVFTTSVQPTSHGEMVYHYCGSGSPVIFLHGVYPGASSYEWSRVYPAFAERRLVLAPDLVGFGESERPSPALTSDQHVRALADFIRGTCQGKKPVVVASGLSAGFAVLLAAQHPELVQALALYFPDSLFGDKPRRALLWRVPVIGKFACRNYLTSKGFLSGWVERHGLPVGEQSGEILEVLTSFARQPGAEHAMLALLAGKLGVDLLSRFEEVIQPVLLISSPKAEEHLGPMIARSEHESLESAPALAALSRPNLFIKRLTNWPALAA